MVGIEARTKFVDVQGDDYEMSPCIGRQFAFMFLRSTVEQKFTHDF